MSDHGKQEGISMVLGALTAASVGTFVFEILGVLLLGVIGALGGWIFENLIKPKLNSLKDKILKNKTE